MSSPEGHQGLPAAGVHWSDEGAVAPSVARMLLAELADVPEWMREGLCWDSPVDFSDRAQRAEAEGICAECPVLLRCQKYRDEERRANVSATFEVIGG